MLNAKLSLVAVIYESLFNPFWPIMNLYWDVIEDIVEKLYLENWYSRFVYGYVEKLFRLVLKCRRFDNRTVMFYLVSQLTWQTENVDSSWLLGRRNHIGLKVHHFNSIFWIWIVEVWPCLPQSRGLNGTKTWLSFVRITAFPRKCCSTAVWSGGSSPGLPPTKKANSSSR